MTDGSPPPRASKVSKPLVTIIVTGYNHEHFIAETLRSVDAQTYDEVEIVFVDGCSTDGTLQAAEACLRQARHPWRTFRQPENLGMVADRAAGFRLAKGDYVCFFDSDDLMHPDKTEKQVRELQEHGCDAVIGSFRWLRADGALFPFLEAPEQADRWDPELFVERLVCSMGPQAQAGLYDRRILAEVGGPDQGLPMNDWPFMIRFARAARKVRVTTDPVFDYRQHPQSHHTARHLELLSWKMKTVKALCSPPVIRKAKARAYRLVADVYLEEWQPARALAWFARARWQGPQPGQDRFLKVARFRLEKVVRRQAAAARQATEAAALAKGTEDDAPRKG